MGGDHMAVKHVSTHIVYKGSESGRTGCGVNTNVKPGHWVNTSSKIRRRKNGYGS